MKVRKIDRDMERIHLCSVCGISSSSAECEEMFEIKGEYSTIHMCDYCFNEMHEEFLKISRKLRQQLK